MQDYQKLKVWVQAHQWVLAIYKASRQFPADERFGLTSQLRRAATSIPANLVEGSGRSTKKDFGHFIQIDLGSCNEVEYLLLLAFDLDLLPESEYRQLSQDAASIRRQLVALQRSVLA